MKKAKIFLIIALVVLSILTCVACSNNNEKNGGIEFTLYEYGREYQVTGLGDFKGDEVVIPESYNGKKVTGIGEYAFTGSSIKKITLSDNVEEILDGAFANCKDLEEIILSEKLETLGAGVFDGSEKIKYNLYEKSNYLGSKNNQHLLLVECLDKTAKNIQINEQAKIIYANAFKDCNGLTSICISDSVQLICNNAFSGCNNLANVTLGEGLKKIESHAFYDCNKIVEVFNKSSLNVRTGQQTATGYVAYNALVVYNGVTNSRVKTDDNGFLIYDDGSKKTLVGYEGDADKIVLPDGLFGIYNRAFYGNKKLVSVTMGEGIVEIGKHAFYNCENLTAVKFPDSAKNIANYAFAVCKQLQEIDFNEKLSSIGDYVFENCVNLQSVSLPKGLSNIGSGVFSGCANLNTITVDAQNENFKSENGVLLSKDGTSLIQYPLGSSLTDYTISDQVKIVGAGAFAGAENLTSVTVGKLVESIGSGTFKNCIKLSSIVYKTGYALKSIGSEAFSGCVQLQNANIPDTVKNLGAGAFSGCESISEASINGVTSISQNLFFGCKNLLSIVIPDTAESIGAKAFSGCELLATVEISEGSLIKGFGEYCFENCKSLTEITIPKKTQNIQKWAFSGCDNLTAMYFLEQSGWWAWNKGYDAIGVSNSVSNPEETAIKFTGWYCKYLWQCSVNS